MDNKNVKWILDNKKDSETDFGSGAGDGMGYFNIDSCDYGHGQGAGWCGSDYSGHGSGYGYGKGNYDGSAYGFGKKYGNGKRCKGFGKGIING